MKLKFNVLTRIKHDGTTYEPGSTIELTPDEAAAMVWAVKAILPARRPAPSKGAAE